MSISILRVKDAEGNIIEIPAIKGDKGDAYILTESDKEEIANMAKPDIDQTYTPESENAQSGKAVAEAISTKSNLEFKPLDVTEIWVTSGLKEGSHIYELKSYVINGGGDCELLFTDNTLLITAPNEAFRVGGKYLISASKTVIDDYDEWTFDIVAEVIDLKDKVNIADIDQTYTPESENAQSGKAVAEAVSNKADKEEWVQIANLTLEEDSIPIISTDTNGNPFNLKKFMVLVWHESKAENTVGNSLWLHAKTLNSRGYKYALQSSSYKGNVQSTHRFDGELWYYWNIRAFAAQGHYVSPSNMAYPYLTVPYGCRDEFMPYREPITGFRVTFGTDGLLNSGTRIEVWGVRA